MQQHLEGSLLEEIRGKACVLQVLENEELGLIGRVSGSQEALFVQKDSFMQSELLAHVGACVLVEGQNALVVGGFDLEMAFELFKHDLQVDFVQEEYRILEALAPFFAHFQETRDHPHFKHYSQILDLEVKKYDLIISLSPLNAHQIDGLQRMLSMQGILICASYHPLLKQQNFKNALEALAPFFAVIMPFFNPYSLTPAYFLFASKHFHPEADMILQKIDMLEDLRHYNAMLHQAAFAQPNWFYPTYKGLLKN
ncbi:spermine/spermidine synthase domain-containing protein [Helicobacter suis]|uniref:Spermidine synthase n=2 Tax=Helicobacter suis TaxID=104628 RepID=E7G3D2_9HELI|nr:spermidine synthase [Helicobacter suis]EFX42119.1 spermidine synthase [Helicobacter suis HS5]EFX43427.1 spermidine synthase [Helicobacter suis HS1]BCD46725.1 Spermidine synthase SpeE [Helicobacter suis]BCD50279.1 Spermidine synthase SpeE [Helicobacter suis]BCD52019.1 Spermidine synthase SpeE [Helicobacter suis]